MGLVKDRGLFNKMKPSDRLKPLEEGRAKSPRSPPAAGKVHGLY